MSTRTRPAVAPRRRRSTTESSAPGVGWRGVAAASAVALGALASALVVAQVTGARVRDPDHVAAGYLAMVGFGVLVMVGIDIALRAARSAGTRRPTREAMRRVREERWTARRGAAVAIALLSFYVTYLAYRNLKAAVPLVRPGDLFDGQLAAADRLLFGGHDPAVLLHSLLGIGFARHVISTAYIAFIVFLPLSLAVALVFAADLRVSLFFTTALSLNWVLGAASYFVLPALGPVYADPGAFAALPPSEVTHLQAVLLDQRVAFLRDPNTGTPQAIAAFASLHISMSFTALVASHLLGLARRLRVALWIWFALTVVSTIYLGWHYVLDDVAGVVIGAAALVLARVLTGLEIRSARRDRPAG
jgi:hypothetical protein